MNNKKLIVLLIFFTLNVFGQSYINDKDNLRKENEIQKMEYSEAYKNTVKDSIDFTGILLEKYWDLVGVTIHMGF